MMTYPSGQPKKKEIFHSYPHTIKTDVCSSAILGFFYFAVKNKFHGFMRKSQFFAL